MVFIGEKKIHFREFFCQLNVKYNSSCKMQKNTNANKLSFNFQIIKCLFPMEAHPLIFRVHYAYLKGKLYTIFLYKFVQFMFIEKDRV